MCQYGGGGWWGGEKDIIHGSLLVISLWKMAAAL